MNLIKIILGLATIIAVYKGDWIALSVVLAVLLFWEAIDQS